MTEAGVRVRPAYLIYRFYWQALDSLFPPLCAGCGKRGKTWCQTCAASICRLSDPICERCGEPLENGRVCRKCEGHPPVYCALRSCAEFRGPLREAVHHLKYQRNLGLGEALCQTLVERYRATGWTVDLVAPVPLGKVRLKERGYNQADLLARPFALASGLRYAPHAVWRARETASQVGLGAAERRENVAGAFQANRNAVYGRRVLVIDDVATTGATISACASALLAAGAEAVWGLTLARAVVHLRSEKAARDPSWPAKDLS
jgi:competence protein ComFC